MYEKEKLRKKEISIKTVRSQSSFVVTTKKKWPKGVLINSLKDKNSYLLYEFYKTLFCRTRFLEHEELSDKCYKENKCDKIAYKTSIIQYFFYFAP
jgi:hypothetical protein